MNRIQPSAKLPKEPPATPQFEVASALFSNDSCDSCDSPHAIFAPLHYESHYAYPLIVWLHGPGIDQRQLMRIMPSISMQNFVAVAPQGILTNGADSSNGGGYCWEQTPDHIQQAEQRIFDGIEAIGRKFHISPRRVFLAGFDCGGTMALRVAMNHPSRFAGVLSLCGPFPSRGTPFSRLTEARKLPVFMAVGRDSTTYPPKTVCQDLRLLHSAGVSVMLRQYPCRHELTHQMLRDVNRWVIEQVTSTNESVPQPRSA
jgi:phospholipase/carboxylesterase